MSHSHTTSVTINCAQGIMFKILNRDENA